MRIHDQLKLSFSNLMRHKVRSILTSLGIIFGVGSVIAMLAISEGAKIQALAQIEAMGTDKIIVATRIGERRFRLLRKQPDGTLRNYGFRPGAHP